MKLSNKIKPTDENEFFLAPGTVCKVITRILAGSFAGPLSESHNPWIEKDELITILGHAVYERDPRNLYDALLVIHLLHEEKVHYVEFGNFTTQLSHFLEKLI